MLSTIKESLFNGLKKSLKGDLFCPNITGQIFGENNRAIGANVQAVNTTSIGGLKATKFNGYSAQGQSVNPSYMNELILNASLSNNIYSDNGLILPRSISKQSYITYK